MKRLVFPRVPSPDVSIVMVTYGAEESARRALAAVVEHTEPRYEVVVVDNASPGGVGPRLARDLEGARVLVNPGNRGFGPANNQGAALARSPLLVFLNSDAFVRPGWLAPLERRMREDPSAGAVAPLLLNEDGTLQEAGALLFANGYTQFVGMGDDPGKVEHRFPREVPYASGACLMVRRRAFFEVHGFDPRYAPAYYEDVDLCLALAEKGFRTLYEPASTVTHARGASSTPELALRLWYRNHPRFVARWRLRLATLPEYTPPDGDPRLQAAARDATASGRILVVSDRFPGADPGDPVALDLVEGLAWRYPHARRTLVPLGRPAADPAIERVCELGWEIADEETVARRPLHYDAVVLRGRRAAALDSEELGTTQPQAVRFRDERTAAELSSDAFVRGLEGALAEAGVVPEAVVG